MKKLLIFSVALNVFLVLAVVLIIKDKTSTEEVLVRAATMCDPNFGEK